ncbi:MAG: AAA family ATPase [Saprospiraceae bacterium]
MKKKFNITGLCYPDQHYMMDVKQKMQEVMDMVESGEYFVINRPRQYGKTTTLYFLENKLSESPDYIPIKMNFQGIDGSAYTSDKAFTKMLIHQLVHFLEYEAPELTTFSQVAKKEVQDLQSLSSFITKFVHKVNKKIILLIDEVDASTNYEPFINFLGMLRTKYLNRYSQQNATFHSIVLAGVHDIKTLKYKIRPYSDSKYLSPWNIAADFEVRMSFNAAEIAPMLAEYTQAEKVTIDIPAMSEQLYYHTSGYPFLVSKLCKTIAEKLVPKKTERTWTSEDLAEAIRLLLRENNTNFDSLIKNLENNQDLYQLVHRIIIDGESVPFNPDEPIIHLGRMYGIFKLNGRVKIHNRIYEQRLYNYLTAKAVVSLRATPDYGGHFLLNNNQLEMEAVLLKFQQFMKEQYSIKSIDFLDHHGRILFLAFLSPILNGHGFAFREVQTSLEKRLDVIVTYFQHQYIIELKQWYGAKAHKKGLDQLADYLDIHGQKNGFLIIFNKRKNKEWMQKTIAHKGKTIFAIWV